MHKKKILIIFVPFAILIAVIFVFYILFFRTYTAKDFNIQTVISDIDKNNNGIDDFTDILLGARKDAQNKPKYVAESYTTGGYPPDNIGVCTDVVWRALNNAGYNLKEMVDEDISNNIELYPAVNMKQDKNIDFRRVRNLKVFFDRFLEIHSNDISNIADFQPGDIVIFGDKYSHIGVISDKRNSRGVPYLIHNSGQPNREENVLEILNMTMTITGHYRFKIKT